MMPTLVPRGQDGDCRQRLGNGYIGGILSIILVLGFIAAKYGNPGARCSDSCRCSVATGPPNQGDRISGPLTGICVIVFVLRCLLTRAGIPR